MNFKATQPRIRIRLTPEGEHRSQPRQPSNSSLRLWSATSPFQLECHPRTWDCTRLQKYQSICHPGRCRSRKHPAPIHRWCHWDQSSCKTAHQYHNDMPKACQYSRCSLPTAVVIARSRVERARALGVRSCTKALVGSLKSEVSKACRWAAWAIQMVVDTHRRDRVLLVARDVRILGRSYSDSHEERCRSKQHLGPDLHSYRYNERGWRGVSV